MASSQGITALLEAEKEAQKIVQKARDYRTARVKEARSEASKDIDDYKSKREAEFTSYQDQFSGSSTNAQGETNNATDEQIESLKSSTSANKDKVVATLLEKVVEVNANLHRNYKPVQA